MVDLIGPADAPYAVTIRPTDGRTFAGADTWFKDCSAPGVADGTKYQAAYINGLLAQQRNAIRRGIVAEVNSDDYMLARAIRSQLGNYYVGGGTSSAYTATSPVGFTFAALADLVGVPLRIKIPATNTGVLTLNVDGTGARPAAYADGTGVIPGDLIIGSIAEFVLDATGGSYQVNMNNGPQQQVQSAFVAEASADQSITASTVTTVTCAVVTNDFLDSTFASSILTIGTKDAGWWAMFGKVIYDFPASGQMYTNATLLKNNVTEIGAGSAAGTTTIRARPTALTLHKFVGGDTVRFQTTTDTTRDIKFAGSGNMFAGFKVGG